MGKVNAVPTTAVDHVIKFVQENVILYNSFSRFILSARISAFTSRRFAGDI